MLRTILRWALEQMQDVHTHFQRKIELAIILNRSQVKGERSAACLYQEANMCGLFLWIISATEEQVINFLKEGG